VNGAPPSGEGNVPPWAIGVTPLVSAQPKVILGKEVASGNCIGIETKQPGRMKAGALKERSAETHGCHRRQVAFAGDESEGIPWAAPNGGVVGESHATSQRGRNATLAWPANHEQQGIEQAQVAIDRARFHTRRLVAFTAITTTPCRLPASNAVSFVKPTCGPFEASPQIATLPASSRRKASKE